MKKAKTEINELVITAQKIERAKIVNEVLSMVLVGAFSDLEKKAILYVAEKIDKKEGE